MNFFIESQNFRVLSVCLSGTCCQYLNYYTYLHGYLHGYRSLFYATNAHSIKHVELLKHIKIMEAAPTCFGLQRNHHQGATATA